MVIIADMNIKFFNKKLYVTAKTIVSCKTKKPVKH